MNTQQKLHISGPSVAKIVSVSRRHHEVRLNLIYIWITCTDDYRSDS